jgi:hypothetical protein
MLYPVTLLRDAFDRNAGRASRLEDDKLIGRVGSFLAISLSVYVRWNGTVSHPAAKDC